jgi:LysM repeat protein
MAYVALDAGHAGFGVTPGKRTPAGEYEWDFNNKVLLAAKAKLEYNGVKVLRVDDPTGKTDVSLSTRTTRANNAGVGLYVSIHHNANTGQWGTWTGTETFTYEGSNPKSEAAAAQIHKRLVGAMGLRDRGLKKANFHVLRETKMAAVLTEGGYMDSSIDIVKLRDNGVLKAAGEAIADGIMAYFGITPKPAPAPTQPAPTNLYRVRKSWADAASQIGAFGDLENAIELAKSKSGYNVYDDNGKQVYPEVVEQMYRVRKSWADASSQIGAFSDLENARELADKNPGYTVYDNSGKALYTYVKPQPLTHTVVKGDTLWGISQEYGVTVDKLRSLNGLTSDVINVGDVLRLSDAAPKAIPVAPAPEPKPEPTPAPTPVENHNGHNDILGSSKATVKQMVGLLKTVNPDFAEAEEVAKAFISVGNIYGIRGDMAFCQSLIETGWFKFDGGTAVTPDQHNYCGMGVTSKGMKGNSFATVEDGVRAQLQHLFAYASKLPLPEEKVLDPRFKYVTRGIAPHWEDLSNRWAMNPDYGKHIVALYSKLLAFVPPVVEEPAPQPEPQPEPKPEPVPVPEPQPEPTPVPVPVEEEKINVGLLNKVLQLIFDFINGLMGKKQ